MEALVIIIINLIINVFIKNSASLEFPLQLTLQILLDGGGGEDSKYSHKRKYLKVEQISESQSVRHGKAFLKAI